MFDIGALEFLVLGILALFIFGPEKLPDMARQAARALRTVRAMAANARRDFSKELGSEFEDLDISDLNPRRFVRKHLLDDVGDDLTISKDDVSVDLGGKPGSKSTRKKTTANGTGTKTATATAKSVDLDAADEAASTDDDLATESELATVAEGGNGVAPLTDAVDAVEAAEEVKAEPSGVALLVRQAPPPFDYEAT